MRRPAMQATGDNDAQGGEARRVTPGDAVDTRGDRLADSRLVDLSGDGRVDSLVGINETSRPSRAPSFSPGDVFDTAGDMQPDSVALDTIGDGRADTIVPLSEALPLQAEVSRLIASVQYDILSVTATILLLAVSLVNREAPTGETLSWFASFSRAAEPSISAFFGVEFILRWWAAGFRGRFLRSRYTVVDSIILLPLGLDTLTAMLASLGAASPLMLPSGPLASLRLLRAGRVLRLLRYFEPEAYGQLVAALGLPFGVDDVQRVVARLAFSVVSIVRNAAAGSNRPAVSPLGRAQPMVCRLCWQ